MCWAAKFGHWPTRMVRLIAGFGMLLRDPYFLGLTFIGPAWSEQKLLSFGYAFEQAGHKRVPPPAQAAQK